MGWVGVLRSIFITVESIAMSVVRSVNSIQMAVPLNRTSQKYGQHVAHTRGHNSYEHYSNQVQGFFPGKKY